jgi:flagellar basal body-associated protein FliL
LLAAKTIGDLEKPGSRNVICAELLSSFNQILGGGAVQEIFLTEFAIQ